MVILRVKWDSAGIHPTFLKTPKFGCLKRVNSMMPWNLMQKQKKSLQAMVNVTKMETIYSPKWRKMQKASLSSTATIRMRRRMEMNGCPVTTRSEEHTSELQSRFDLVCRLLLEKKKQ